MNYTFQVAYLNTIRPKKVIPKNLLQEIENNKNIANLVSVLKEFKYTKIFLFSVPEISILDATNFENVLLTELYESLDLISSLLLNNHKWFIEFLKFFINPTEIYSSNFVLFFEHYNKLFLKIKSNLCKKLFNLITDFENIKLFISYVITQRTHQELIFIPFGSIDEKKLKQLFPSIESLNKFLNFSLYPKTKVSEKLQKESINFYFNLYLEELIWQSRFYYFTIEPIVFYFFEKLIETQRLKKVYYTIKTV